MGDGFAGDHWGRGYDEEVMDGWSDSSASDRETSSSEDEQVWTPNTARISQIRASAADVQAKQREAEEERMRAARATLEQMGERAYWRKPGQVLDSVAEGAYGWKTLSTGEPALDRSSRTLTRQE
jgi:gamma-tubulin complex component 5